MIISNTCAYDSILQILACAYSDFEGFKNFIDTLLSSKTEFQIVRDTAMGSITSKTYFIRAAWLKNICKSSLLPNNILNIEAECTATIAAKNIFREFPPVTEISRCSEKNCETNS